MRALQRPACQILTLPSRSWAATVGRRRPQVLVTHPRCTPNGWEAITEIRNEAILTTTTTFETETKTLEERRPWFEAHDERHPIFVEVVVGQVAGWSSLNRRSNRRADDYTAETSFYVRSASRGQGVGRALKEATIDEARRLGFHTLNARIAEGSDASPHLNQSVGFVLVGTLRKVGRKFGRLRDVYLLQKML